MEDVAVVHIADVVSDARFVLDGVVELVRYHQRHVLRDLTAEGCPAGSVSSQLFHEPCLFVFVGQNGYVLLLVHFDEVHRQCLEPFVLPCFRQLLSAEAVLNAIEKAGEIVNQGEEVASALPYLVFDMSHNSAPGVADAFSFGARWVVINEGRLGERRYRAVAQCALDHSTVDHYGVDVSLLAAFADRHLLDGAVDVEPSCP